GQLVRGQAQVRRQSAFGVEAAIDDALLAGVLITDDDPVFLIRTDGLPAENGADGAPTDGFQASRLPGLAAHIAAPPLRPCSKRIPASAPRVKSASPLRPPSPPRRRRGRPAARPRATRRSAPPRRGG